MEQAKTIFCPAALARLHLKSESLDNLSPFSQFLIWALNKGYSKDRIVRTIDLGPAPVEEELSYLCALNIVDPRGGLTPLGVTYARLAEKIREFNSSRFGILLNCHTGKLEILDENFVFASPQPSDILDTNVSMHKYLRDNHPAIRKIFDENFAKKLGIPAEFGESIVVSTQLENTDGLCLEFEADAEGNPAKPLYYKRLPASSILAKMKMDVFGDTKDALIKKGAKTTASAARVIKGLFNLFTRNTR